MNAQIAEIPAEAHLVFDRDILIAKYQNLMLSQRIAQCLLGPLIQWLAEIDAADFRTQMNGNLIELRKHPNFGIVCNVLVH